MTPQHIGTSQWTHSSVRRLAGTQDPVEAMIAKARVVALDAMERGWIGPPFDPFALAELLKMPVTPAGDVTDARTVPCKDGVRIEFNPSRPKARIRYSIAHEIAHTLFPDCADRIRYRQDRTDMRLDDWQLEMLCNIGAAELLMPIGSLPAGTATHFGIDHVLELRKKFEVSVEAVLLRLTRLAACPCLMFAASSTGLDTSGYKIDYSVASREWRAHVIGQVYPPRNTVLAECIAIGHTGKRLEYWKGLIEELRIECVGVQPFPKQVLPRVIGIAKPVGDTESRHDALNVLVGDATNPRGHDKRIIVHVINDKALSWGGGFARSLAKRWPKSEADFKSQIGRNGEEFRLGHVYISEVDRELTVASLVAQKGYGKSPMPRIRYSALSNCLEQIATLAIEQGASLHMPQIGCGEAGGSWHVVEEMLNTILVAKGLTVTVYKLPGQQQNIKEAANLFGN